MADFQMDITSLIREEMPSILRNELTDIVRQGGTLTNAEQLLLLCQVFTSKVEIAKSEIEYFGNTVYRSRMVGRGKRIRKAELMTYGAQLIYLIRQFITGEEIIFHIGVRTNGQYSGDAFVPQSEVMKNLRGVSRNAIGLSHEIERLLITLSEEKSDEQFVNKWITIEQLANVINEPYDADSKKQVGWDNKTNRAIYAYQKQTADFKVYIKFGGKNGTRRSKYYDLHGDLVGFNNGWLWEWYDSIYNGGSDEQISRVHGALDSGSLEPLFQEFDNTPGVKQGDYMDIKGRQIQNKYDNMKIISYNNILGILYELTAALNLFIANNGDAQSSQNLLNILKTTFIPESSQQVAKVAEEVLDREILSKLTSFSIT